jgi:carbonic anhydrase
MLLSRNQAWASGRAECTGQSPARRAEVAAGQHPIAIVVGCSDSRVPPEALFGQGLGDLFVIRVAGNVVDDDVLGSVEYAAEHLGVSLVMVLGHERCGAVEAALAGEGAAHVAAIVSRIRPAIERARKQPGDPLENAVRDNVANSVREIASSQSVLAPMIKQGKLKIVGARYDLDSGLVEVIP